MQRVTVVPPGQSPRRLDRFVSTQSANVSRAAVQRWITSGLITVNGRRAKAAQRIRPGDVIASHLAIRPPITIEPEDLPLRVLHEDAEILVVDKPAGVTMHPAPGNWTGTLLNALVHHVSRVPEATGRRARPGLVHRLDKGTSGVVVVAKTDRAHRDLSRQFHAHAIDRMYLALVAGAVRHGGVIDRPIGRDVGDDRRISARSAKPRGAVTEFRVAERLSPDATLVEVRPRTGRMHQIRVHLAGIGHAVVGDATYGDAGAAALVPRPMLHAALLGFVHPTSGARIECRAALPADMQATVERYRSAR